MCGPERSSGSARSREPCVGYPAAAAAARTPPARRRSHPSQTGAHLQQRGTVATSAKWVCIFLHICHISMHYVVWTSPAGGNSAKEMSSTRLRRRRWSLRWHQPLLRQHPGRMVTAPPTSLPRLRTVRVPKLAPAIQRPVRAPCRALRLLSQDAGRG